VTDPCPTSVRPAGSRRAALLTPRGGAGLVPAPPCTANLGRRSPTNLANEGRRERKHAAPGFIAQPWQELAGAYERSGQPAAGRRLRFAAERQVTKHLRARSRPVRWGYQVLVGYGIYPLVAGAWLLGAALLTLALAIGFDPLFSPTDLAAATAPGWEGAITGATACSDLAAGYPCFTPGVYALEVMLPIAQTGQVAAWAPPGTALAGAVIAIRALVWLMTVLLIAGVTGLLRPNK
jgi:hypothetical protein